MRLANDPTVAFVFDTSMLFVAKLLQEVHHYSPANLALMYLTIGGLVPIGDVVAGRLGHRFGRKRRSREQPYGVGHRARVVDDRAYPTGCCAPRGGPLVASKDFAKDSNSSSG